MAETETAGPSARERHTLSAQIVDVIESRGLSAYAAAKLAGVDPGAIRRFMTGKTGMTSETFDRLGRALGLRIVEVAARKRRARPKRKRAPAVGPAVEEDFELAEEPAVGAEGGEDA